MGQYIKDRVPINLDELVEFLEREFQNIEDLQISHDEIKFEVLTIEPRDLATGLLVYADGTDWNPGSGEGLYIRTSTPAWVKL